MPARLPPHLYSRTYRTAAGRDRRLWYARFQTWQGFLLVEPAGDNQAIAIKRRDQLRSLNTLRYDFREDPDNVLGRREGLKGASETLQKWIDRWLTLKQGKRSLAKDRSNSLRLLRFFTGLHGDVALSEITTYAVEDYRLARTQEHDLHGNLPKPATINRELALLRSLLRMAQEQDALTKLPKIRLLLEHNERHRTATRGEFERLLVALAHRPDVSDALEILWEQGLREDEVVSLKWAQVDFATQTLIFPSLSTKTKEGREPPMSPRTYEILAQRAAQVGGPWVFTTTRGGRLRARWFKRLVSKAMGVANIRGLWVHDLRGTFITRKVIEEGYDRKLVKVVTGHSTDYAFERYLRPSLEHQRAMMQGRKRYGIATQPHPQETDLDN